MLRFVNKHLVAALLAAFVTSSQAFTYLPMTDENLLEQSPVVVLGQVLSVSDSLVSTSTVTQYQIAVEQVIKGEVPVNVITVQTPGSRLPTANSRWFPGMPTFEAADALLLFLQPGDDGLYRIMQLGLGAFVLQEDALGELVFVRQLDDTQRLDAPTPLANAIAEVPRSAEAFLGQLGGEPQLGAVRENSARHNANYTFMTSPASRWFEFDEGQSVPFYAHTSGQSQMVGGGFTEFQNALKAWNNDAGSNVRYSYAGKTSASSDFETNDGLNVILFNDPHGDVPGTFDCNGGGVLASGGFVTSGETRIYNGSSFGVVAEADIVTNNGAGCFFKTQNGRNGEEVFAHELGHTLGLGHSCGESGLLVADTCSTASAAKVDALMRAYPHEDGRGASLRTDDRAGMAFLYKETAAPPPSSGGGSGAGGSTGGQKKSSGGGGGGCALNENAAPDPTLWILSLVAFAWLARKRILLASSVKQ